MAISPAGADIRITSDPGGALDRQLERVEAVRQSGEHVIIDAPCYSSCTLWLSLPPSQLCATPRAVFGFHSAMDSVTGMPSPKWNEALMRAHPPHVRNLISRRGRIVVDRDDLREGDDDRATVPLAATVTGGLPPSQGSITAAPAPGHAKTREPITLPA